MSSHVSQKYMEENQLITCIILPLNIKNSKDTLSVWDPHNLCKYLWIMMDRALLGKLTLLNILLKNSTINMKVIDTKNYIEPQLSIMMNI